MARKPVRRTTKKQPAKKARAATTTRRPVKKSPAKRAPRRREIPVTRGELLHIPLAKVQPDPKNERRKLEGIDELADSIREVGVVEPVVVLPADKDGMYPMVFGHRRLAGAKKARLQTIPALVRDLDEAGRAEYRLIENLQRDKIHPHEEATGYQGLVDLGWTQRKIAERVGRSQAHVSKTIALLALPSTALDALDSERITATDAYELVKLKDHPDRITELLDDPDEIEWSVREELREVTTVQKVAELYEQQKAKGASVLTDGEASVKGAKRIDSWGGVDVDKRKHAKEPCHAVVIRRTHDSAELQPVCTEPARHNAKGDSDLKVPAPAGASATAKAEMKARREATKARRAFMTDRLATRPDRNEVLDLVARRYIGSATATELKAVGELLGPDIIPAADKKHVEDWRNAIDSYVIASEINLQRACLAYAFVQGEDAYHRFGQDHYRYLVAHGYEPNAVEKADFAAIPADAQALFADEERSSEPLAEQRLANDHAMVEALGLEPGDELQDDGSILHEDGTITPAEQVGERVAEAGGPSWPPAPLTPVHPDQATIDDVEPPTDGEWGEAGPGEHTADLEDDDPFNQMRNNVAASDDEDESVEVDA